ncbi:Hypothetical predicted protein [Pelobates cultripes]|uniref:Uncharacterized protein n=1 Tax=Pelobates cultripes TaxID=61616 RepID=A0AAD1RXZ8_PELCU|nr:Hypothetical predicted protein [Pelobates cultripes]
MSEPDLLRLLQENQVSHGLRALEALMSGVMAVPGTGPEAAVSVDGAGSGGPGFRHAYRQVWFDTVRREVGGVGRTEVPELRWRRPQLWKEVGGEGPGRSEWRGPKMAARKMAPASPEDRAVRALLFRLHRK